jgi:hypothetical protein
MDHVLLFCRIEATLRSERIRIQVITETEVVPQLRLYEEAPGWYKQQVVKLAAHRIVNSPFYLLLDADLICTHEFSDLALIVDGKALTDWELKSLHTEWWQGSAAILKTFARLDNFGFSVTPEVLSKYVGEKLLQHITNLYQKDWCEVLLENRVWTEFTLYCLFATQEGYLDHFHHTKEWMESYRKAIRSQQNVWLEEDFKTWRPKEAFSPEATGIFMVCQSNTQIHPKRVWRKVHRFLR